MSSQPALEPREDITGLTFGGLLYFWLSRMRRVVTSSQYSISSSRSLACEIRSDRGVEVSVCDYDRLYFYSMM